MASGIAALLLHGTGRPEINSSWYEERSALRKDFFLLSAARIAWRQGNHICWECGGVGVLLSQPAARLEGEFLFLAVALNDQRSGGAGFDKSDRVIAVQDRVGPAAIDRQQTVAGLEAGGGGGTARPDFLDIDPGI